MQGCDCLEAWVLRSVSCLEPHFSENLRHWEVKYRKRWVVCWRLELRVYVQLILDESNEVNSFNLGADQLASRLLQSVRRRLGEIAQGALDVA